MNQTKLKPSPEKVGIDSFLYSCLEQEKTLKAIPYRLKGLERWPLARTSEEEPGHLKGKDTEELLKDMCEWYGTKFPELLEKDDLNLKVLSALSSATVFIHHDLLLIYNAQSEDEEDILPSLDGQAENPFWKKVFAGLKTSYPHWSNLIINFFRWNYNENPPEDLIEPGDVPPVGMFSPFVRRGFGGAGGRPGGDRGPRRSGGDRGASGNRRPGGDRGGDRGGRGERGGRNDRGGDRGGRSDRGERGQRGPAEHQGRGRGDGHSGRGDRHGGPKRGDRERQHNPERDQEFEAKAIQEVLEAVAQLRSNPGMEEVRLKPTNSFYRRIQHQRAKDEGMNSISVGEGADRALTIRRV